MTGGRNRRHRAYIADALGAFRARGTEIVTTVDIMAELREVRRKREEFYAVDHRHTFRGTIVSMPATTVRGLLRSHRKEFRVERAGETRDGTRLWRVLP